jgi:hypothetical protein
VSQETAPERRRHQRAYLPLAASLFTENGKVGDYLVRDLSSGGALFTHGPPIPVGTALQAILVGQGVDGLSLRCIALRSDDGLDGSSRVAVEFRTLPSSIQDLLQDLVLRALDRAKDPAVLLVHRRPLLLASLAEDLVAAGRWVFLATTPLETIRSLCDLDATIEAILVDQSHDPSFGRAILELVKDDFPAVRRIALCAGTTKNEIARTLATVHANDVLDVPWTPSGLEAALERQSRRTGQRTSSPDAL